MAVRTIVATGASSGLGFEAIKQLLSSSSVAGTTTSIASRSTDSYRVHLGARDVQAAGRAYEALEYDRAKHTVRITHLNLESLYSVRRFSQDILATLSVDTVGNATNEAQSGESLDCLLLCAGVVNGSGPPAEGDPKHCLAYTVNYLSQHYLIHLLSERIIKDKTRITVVSSQLYKQIRDPDTLDEVLSSSTKASRGQIYPATKYVQLLSCLWWRRELGPGPQVVAVSPGFVPSTGLSREYGFLANLAMRYILSHMPFATTLKAGGRAIVRAMQGKYELEDEDHLYLDKDGSFKPLEVSTLDFDLQNKWCPTKQAIEALIENGADQSSS